MTGLLRKTTYILLAVLFALTFSSCTKNGWKRSDGEKYYYIYGVMATDVMEISGIMCDFDSDGIYQGEYTGWYLSDSGTKYYEDGLCLSGDTYEIDGAECAFSKDGVLEEIESEDVSYSANALSVISPDNGYVYESLLGGYSWEYGAIPPFYITLDSVYYDAGAESISYTAYNTTRFAISLSEEKYALFINENGEWVSLTEEIDFSDEMLSISGYFEADSSADVSSLDLAEGKYKLQIYAWINGEYATGVYTAEAVFYIK